MSSKNGSTAEALNDMAIDLKVRGALASDNTKLTLSYNAAVVLSICVYLCTHICRMCVGGFVSETLAISAFFRKAVFSKSLIPLKQIQNPFDQTLLASEQGMIRYAASVHCSCSYARALIP